MTKDFPIGSTAVHPAYSKVADVFKANFDRGWEYEGAAFAAYVDGELVVDLWGGYADRRVGWTWKEDTMTTVFSCTKALSSICLASLVERGLLSYYDTVSKYWPEFGREGKDKITVQHVLCHQAGIPYFRNANGSLASLRIEDITDVARMEQLVEEQKPQYTPGSRSAYHALTFGWLLDGVFRRLEPQGRQIGQYLKEEIADKYNLDLFIGGTKSEEHRIARIFPVTSCLTNMIRETVSSPYIAKVGCRKFIPCTTFTRAVNNYREICPDFDIFNNPDMRTFCMAAANGVGTARSLAKALDLFGSGQIVSNEFLQTIREPLIVDQMDGTIGDRISKGYGFMYSRSPLGEWQIGHTGVGGQNVKTDPERRISFAYLSNGMKAGQGERTGTMKRLEKALYECYQNMHHGMETINGNDGNGLSGKPENENGKN